jgi:hypothetical protein
MEYVFIGVVIICVMEIKEVSDVNNRQGISLDVMLILKTF